MARKKQVLQVSMSTYPAPASAKAIADEQVEKAVELLSNHHEPDSNFWTNRMAAVIRADREELVKNLRVRLELHTDREERLILKRFVDAFELDM